MYRCNIKNKIYLQILLQRIYGFSKWDETENYEKLGFYEY